MSRQWNMAYHDPSDDAGSAGRQTCPQCGEPLLRMRRRIVDRLTSFFQPVQRFRCRSHRCQWQGNISVKSMTADTPSEDPRT